MNPGKNILFLSVISAFLFNSVPVLAFQTTDIVLIPAGSFNMGDAFSEGTAEELPVYPVTLSAH